MAQMLFDAINRRRIEEQQMRIADETTKRSMMVADRTAERQEALETQRHGNQLIEAAVGDPLKAEAMGRAGMKIPPGLGRTNAQRVAPIAGDIAKTDAPNKLMTGADVINRAEFEGELPEARGVRFGSGRIPTPVPARPEIAHLLKQRKEKEGSLASAETQRMQGLPHQGPQGPQRLLPGGQAQLEPKPVSPLSDEEEYFELTKTDPVTAAKRLVERRKFASAAHFDSQGSGGGMAGIQPTRPPIRLITGDPATQAIVDAVHRMAMPQHLRVSAIMQVQDYIQAGDTERATETIRDFAKQSLNSGQLEDYTNNSKATSTIESALARLDPSVPNGPWASLGQQLAPWVGIQRDERFTAIWQGIEQGQSAIRRSFFGTAVTGTEAGKADAFLLKPTDDYQTMVVKLQQNKDFLRFANDAMIAQKANLPKPKIEDYIGYYMDVPVTGGAIKRVKFSTQEELNRFKKTIGR